MRWLDLAAHAAARGHDDLKQKFLDRYIARAAEGLRPVASRRSGGCVDRDRSTLTHLQTELGRAIAQQIRLRLSPQRDQALIRRQARSPDAYEHYLRGRALWAKPNRAALLAAIDEYKQATAIDPEYALRMRDSPTRIRRCRSPRTCHPWRLPGRHGRRPRARFARTQLLAEAHAAFGWQEFFFGWNWPAAEASLRRAIALDPNYANARRSLGHVLSNSGRHSEALAEMARARELDPFSRAPLMHVLSAQTAYRTGLCCGGEARAAVDRHRSELLGRLRQPWPGSGRTDPVRRRARRHRGGLPPGGQRQRADAPGLRARAHGPARALKRRATPKATDCVETRR